MATVRFFAAAAEAAAWLAENEDEFAITPERLAAAEKAKAAEEAEQASAMLRGDENESPVAGRRASNASNGPSSPTPRPRPVR